VILELRSLEEQYEYKLTETAHPMMPRSVTVATMICTSRSFCTFQAGTKYMIGKYSRMKSTKPIKPGVVIPALSGSVFFMCKKLGNIELRIRTNA
jgi:hypothetical protein